MVWHVRYHHSSSLLLCANTMLFIWNFRMQKQVKTIPICTNTRNDFAIHIIHIARKITNQGSNFVYDKQGHRFADYQFIRALVSHEYL